MLQPLAALAGGVPVFNLAPLYEVVQRRRLAGGQGQRAQRAAQSENNSRHVCNSSAARVAAATWL